MKAKNLPKLYKVFYWVRCLQKLKNKFREIVSENIRTKNLTLKHYKIISDKAVGQLYLK